MKMLNSKKKYIKIITIKNLLNKKNVIIKKTYKFTTINRFLLKNLKFHIIITKNKK